VTRQIVLDTETTGLEPKEGHRIIEIGCVELVGRRFTGHNFHRYLQPDREIDEDAISVHGITQAFLRDKPRFADIAEELMDYLRGAELIIHNAAFDIGFLDHELGLLDAEHGRVTDHCAVLDTLALARRIHPGQRNSLDALCRRYEVDNTRRELHGALLDAEILGDVYLAMTGGQTMLDLAPADGRGANVHGDSLPVVAAGLDLPVVRATAEELEAHRQRLDAIEAASDGRCVWRLLEE
jgi:DNA polymerase-3 subunit epsilon